jgi:predicted nucleic acid-binding protein
MNNWLCDTNVISELMRRKPFPRVAKWLGQQDEIHLSVITVEEIFFGLRRKDLSRKRAWFEKFLASRCRILEIDAPTAQRAGDIRGRLAASGLSRSQADMLIAATAWRHDLIVVTRNTADFDGTAVPVFNPFEE